MFRSFLSRWSVSKVIWLIADQPSLLLNTQRCVLTQHTIHIIRVAPPIVSVWGPISYPRLSRPRSKL